MQKKYLIIYGEHMARDRMEETMELIEILEANYSDDYSIAYNMSGNNIKIKCKDSMLCAASVNISNNTVEFSTGEFKTVKKHYSDESMVIRELPLFLQMVEGIFFVEKEGVPDMVIHHLQYENYEAETQNIINEYIAEGTNVVAIEYYSVNPIPPQLVADKITHAYLVKLLENRFAQIKAYFPYAEEGTRYENLEYDTDESAIDDNKPFTDWDRAMFMPSKNHPMKIVAVQTDQCILGNIFNSIYIFPFDAAYSLPLDSETMTKVYLLLQDIHFAYYGERL